MLVFIAMSVHCAAHSQALRPVKVGIYQNEPKVYIDSEGRPAGFFPKILRYIAEKEGWELHYIPCTWNECLNKAESGQLDLIMDVAFSEARAKRFTFNREVAMINWSRVYTRDGSTIRTIIDLDDKKVSLVEGSIQERKLRQTAREYNIHPEFIGVKSFAAVFDMVEKGVADAGVVNRLFGAQQRDNFGLHATNILLYPSRLMFAGSTKMGDALLDRIDFHLKALKQDPQSLYYAALEETLAPAKKPIAEILSLSREESAWLNAHAEIKIAVNKAWPPMNYVNAQGVPRGIGVAFLQALNSRLDGRLKIVPLSWMEMLEDIRKKRVDAVMDITPRPDREFFVHFTKPYCTVPHVIVARKDAPYYGDLAQLEGKTAGVERGFFLESVLKERYPDIEVTLFENTSDALDAVSKGRIDAYVGNRAVALYIMEHELIANLVVHGKIEETASVNAIGVRRDWPELRDILQKALDSLDKNEESAIFRTEINFYEEYRGRITLTPQEKAWITAHPVLSLGYDADWPPIEYVNKEGRYAGMSSEFMKLFATITGIAFNPVAPGNWQAAMDGIKRGDIDILLTVAPTPQREKFLLFSTPYLRFPMVIVTDREAPYISDMKALNGKKVVVVGAHASHDILKERHPELDLVAAATVKEGLNAVKRRKAYAFIGSLATVSHMIAKEGMLTLKVAGEVPYKYDLAVGVHKDQPVLAGIMQKAVDAITAEDRNEIYQRWIAVTYEQQMNYALLVKIVLGALLCITAVLYWNRRMAREIGLRKKAEGELMIAKDVAESANRVKSAFLAGMSHELRTPLNSIIGFTGIILNEIAGPLNLEQKKQLKMVKGSAGHLLNLINDVLDISKIEAGELKLSCEEFNMRDVVAEVAASLAPIAGQKGLSFAVDIAPDVGTMFSDERRLRQVLINLVNNAIKFTEKGSVHVTCARRGSMMEITVRDSGIGIKEEDMDKLFHPFQQLDSGISRRYEGTGLGLSVSRHIIEMLGGAVHVESRFGEGSTFTFTVPLEPRGDDGEKKNSGYRRQ